MLFHSVLGLRPVEHRFAARLREAGHHVDIPGLFGGRTASTLDAGFAIKDDIGWATLERRAAEALDGLPADTVLVGLSMGAALAQNLLPHRPAARALLLHALAAHPAPAPGVDVQVHVADPDPFAPPAALDAWRAEGGPGVP